MLDLLFCHKTRVHLVFMCSDIYYFRKVFTLAYHDSNFANYSALCLLSAASILVLENCGVGMINVIENVQRKTMWK